MAKTRKNSKNTKNTNSNKRASGSASKIRYEVLESLEDEVVVEDVSEEEEVQVIAPLDLSQTMVPIPEEGDFVEEHPGAWTEVIRRKKTTPSPQTSATHGKVTLQLTDADVLPEINYWSSSLYGYIMGTNPPWNVVSGYLKRIWKDYDVDKISFMPNGIFIVRFKAVEKMKEVVKTGHFMFDNKPVIINEWSPEVDLIKTSVQTVPIWVKLTGLDLKFWGVASLKKISGLIGDFVHCDEATTHKTFLGYARLLVDVKVDQSFPASLQFKDEKGKVHNIKVEYDWVPVKCTQCQGIGHSKDQCRKKKEIKKVKPVWQKEGPRVAVIQTSAGIITRVMSQDGSGPSVHRGNTFLDALNMATIRNTHLRKKGTGNGLGGVIENETKVKSVHWNKVRNAICSDWSICTNNSFASGGRIWLLWNSGLLEVDILDITSQTIHAQITIKGNKLVFRFTLVYGYNKPAERVDLWKSLQRYKSMHHGPWLVGGDFNNLLFSNERLGGAEVTLADIKPFQDCLHCCDLVDIKAIGSFFTWNNKQELETLVYSRLDGCLINDDWMNLFPEAYAYIMPEGYFDHCPCVVYPFGKPLTRKPRFKYFNMWRLDPNFNQVVSEGWHKEFRGTQMFQHVCKLKHLKHDLKRLNKGAMGDIKNKVKVAKVALHKMQEELISNPMDPGLVGAAKTLADELVLLKAAWYMFLEQKAKVDWTAMGDDNTHYFHSQLKHRRAQNKVIQIKDQGGKLCTDSSAIQQAFIEYYHGLLGSSNTVDNVCESVIAAGPILTAAHHEILTAEVSSEEIRKAMFDIGGNKAPGPDGFNSQFYKDTWEIIGKVSLRILGKIQEYTKFRYHPLCSRIKLTHLAFADDLLLFCRGDRNSIIGLLRAFQSFSRASGLQMNKGKSSLYSNGVDQMVLTDILKHSGMKHGSLPFKYLGIPIASKKLSVMDCNCLVERVVSRIRSIGSRKLSYAGRLVLIKSVLATLHNYWARIFILPSSILKKIIQICRNFLWTGLDNDKGNTLVSWEQICKDKKHGGLGITYIIRWNKAALGKYIWWLAQKKDHLWVEWVHNIYIKSGEWHSYQPKNNGSWAWRKLCKIRDLIKAGFVGAWWLQNQQVYTISSGYDWLGSPCMNVPWANFVWDSGALPKISFIGWLVMQGRLLTRERLKRLGITLDDSCVLCARASETHDHLFFACEYSKRCLQILSSKLGCHLPSQGWFAWWNSQVFPSQKIQQHATMFLLGLIYSIWWSRNHCRTESVLLRPEYLIARFEKSSFFVM
ncbi:uncharacterized protein LOC141589828 [Silene latifolia]|uniref:uncharacterized protein LOC141589828 n=1 Tax=Silene latifolia TaxID=37657 RepID=UPI003D78A481